MVEADRRLDKETSSLCKALVALIEHGVPRAALENALLPTFNADVARIWNAWVDVARLHYNSARGISPADDIP